MGAHRCSVFSSAQLVWRHTLGPCGSWAKWTFPPALSQTPPVPSTRPSEIGRDRPLSVERHSLCIIWRHRVWTWEGGRMRAQSAQSQRITLPPSYALHSYLTRNALCPRNHASHSRQPQGQEARTFGGADRGDPRGVQPVPHGPLWLDRLPRAEGGHARPRLRG